MIVGFTCGAFDLLHAGHVSLFESCKKHCDYLIVGLQTDPTIDRKSKNRPVQSMYERYLQLKSCRYVNVIIPYDCEDDLLNLIATAHIDMRFLGSDYIDKDFTGKYLCNKLNIEVVYIPREHNFSSSELRNRIENQSSILRP